MSSKLEELNYHLNCHQTEQGTRFDAVLSVQGHTLEVTCSDNPDFPIYMTATDQQLLTVTPLFARSDVDPQRLDELHKVLLMLSPIVPLSAIGLQDDTYILFGAMALNTAFETIAHEQEVQANNTLDVLEALSDYLVL